jgi:hypothetical protein
MHIARVCGERRPLDRPLDRHSLGAAFLEELDEVLERQANLLELHALATSDPQIVRKRVMQAGHDPAPGHARATDRSVSTSTFA